MIVVHRKWDNLQHAVSMRLFTRNKCLPTTQTNRWSIITYIKARFTIFALLNNHNSFVKLSGSYKTWVGLNICLDYSGMHCVQNTICKTDLRTNSMNEEQSHTVHSPFNTDYSLKHEKIFRYHLGLLLLLLIMLLLNQNSMK